MNRLFINRIHASNRASIRIRQHRYELSDSRAPYPEDIAMRGPVNPLIRGVGVTRLQSSTRRDQDNASRINEL